jgi:3-deoxy-D-manno-octulosonate 8-phosphate phosphatase (KDO 8-P phosphatase)
LRLKKEALIHKARIIELLLLDVDGVLTDGRILYDEKGNEIKVFHVQDGQGIRWLLKAGIRVGLLSGRSSRAVETRARELGISLLFQGVKDKKKLFPNLLRQTGLHPESVSFMGDDFIDFPLLKMVGLSVSVPNGHPLIQKEVDYVTKAPGGFGAVREVSELLLKARGRWPSLLKQYEFL